MRSGRKAVLEGWEFAGRQMLEGELIGDANTNPLHWWKKWGSKFPNPSQSARRYLAMPVTSAVPGMGHFSVAGFVAAAKRNRLDP